MSKQLEDVSVHPNKSFNYEVNRNYFYNYSRLIGNKPSLAKVFLKLGPVIFGIILARVPVLNIISGLVSLIEKILWYIPAVIVRLISYIITKSRYDKLIVYCGEIEKEIDNNVDTIEQNVTEEAIKVLHVRPDTIEDKIVLKSYFYNSKFTPVYGTDNLLRANTIKYLIFIFTQNEIFSYSTTYSLIDSVKVEEAISTFYQDVAVTGTEQSYMKLYNYADNTYYVKPVVDFWLRTKGDNKVHIPLEDDDTADKKVRKIRQMLQEKKNIKVLLADVLSAIKEN